MALPGLLIEYLVVGSMALLWALPLANIDISGQIPFGSAAALAPAIYVLGMFVDFIAFALLSQLPIREYSLKQLIRNIANSSFKKSDPKHLQNNMFASDIRRNSTGIIRLGLDNPELLREVNERSSRDRIARGAFINILLLWGVSLWSNTPTIFNFNTFQWVGLALFSLMVWTFLEWHSYRFELSVGREVKSKNVHPSSRE